MPPEELRATRAFRRRHRRQPDRQSRRRRASRCERTPDTVSAWPRNAKSEARIAAGECLFGLIPVVRVCGGRPHISLEYEREWPCLKLFMEARARSEGRARRTEADPAIPPRSMQALARYLSQLGRMGEQLRADFEADRGLGGRRLRQFSGDRVAGARLRLRGPRAFWETMGNRPLTGSRSKV